ncbi:hypothetical protein FA13DRAFT_1738695 [Coprinellus micaceus]|uniref:Uncharacterized protein n=1 Tax=Coprinellus micaceus TaxID=71717 RepID=A0A4Y7STZ8_COPMI|nr:hypothetical protein FA13DRAFT_1738695 [Coprinellus micaceus]
MPRVWLGQFQSFGDGGQKIRSYRGTSEAHTVKGKSRLEYDRVGNYSTRHLAGCSPLRQCF